MRVLITNDHEWTLRSLESVLSSLDVEVSRAFTLAQTLEQLSRKSFDLVFLDTNLPDGEGVELCRIIRERGLVDVDVPVIVTTSGQVSRADRLRSHEAGAWDYLTEPIDGALLMARVRTYVAARRGARARGAAILEPASGLYLPDGLARRARELAADAARHHHALCCLAVRISDLADATASPLDVSSLVTSVARTSDVVGRLDEQTFVVLAGAAPAEGMQALFARIVSAVESSASARRSTTGAWACEFVGQAADGESVLRRTVAALGVGAAVSGRAIAVSAA